MKITGKGTGSAVNIFLLSQYFPPETGAAPHRAFYHAVNWAKSGHGVTVVTNFPNSPHGRLYKGFENRLLKKEKIKGVTVIRVFTFAAGKKSKILRRFLSSLLYVIMAQICLFQKKPDVIVGSAPYFAGFAAFLVAKIRRIPLVYEMRDPWLQILGQNIQKKGIYFRFLEKVEKKMLHYSDRVVVIGERMSEAVARRYELKQKPIPIFNGIETEDIAEIPEKVIPHIADKIKGMFTIGFVGNLGVWYDYDVIIKVADYLKNKPVVYLFVGDGKLKQDLIEAVKRRRLSNIYIFDVLPHKQALAVVRACDLTILPFKRDVCNLCLPLKFFESLALGTPVLVCNGEEAGQISRKFSSGAFIDGDDPKELASVIEDYLQNPWKLESEGNAGKKYIVENFNRKKMAETYTTVFNEITKKMQAAGDNYEKNIEFERSHK